MSHERQLVRHPVAAPVPGRGEGVEIVAGRRRRGVRRVVVPDGRRNRELTLFLTGKNICEGNRWSSGQLFLFDLLRLSPGEQEGGVGDSGGDEQGRVESHCEVEKV